ncbi:helix-turn-helix domain-containing protein [Kitasatospora sp. McL0602]|uniref:helix-turn-helix domain-containing protein n=1 Tax=Kitasatospora sp. McL0602 TaxID=3439530 RepID=UPI003F899624
MTTATPAALTVPEASGTAPAVPDQDLTLVALTVEEAARRLSIGRTTMYALIRDGEIPTVPIGRLRRVPAEVLAEYLRRLMNSVANHHIAS